MLTPQEIFDELLRYYGKPQWWSDNPYQVMVEAVLVQRTTWSNVEKMRTTFGGKLRPAYIQALSQKQLEELIRPCGFHRAKARSIKALTEWFMQYRGDSNQVRHISLERLRCELLSLYGIGAETADVILVYCFLRPSFIVDAYTRTFLMRLGYLHENDREIKNFFEQGLDIDAKLYGHYHWLILEHCIALCRKKPLCKECPFARYCETVNTWKNDGIL